jgi:Tfp pilus assembly protein FimV
VRDASSRRALARYAAPAAFLLGVTIAVLLVRSGLGGGGTKPTTALGPVTHPTTVQVAPTTAGSTTSSTTAGAQFYVVRKGDTFGSIAAKEGTTVAQLEQLNPGVSSNALQVGQKIRIR